MALQVWLPLNGNLNNQGLSNLKFSIANSATSINDAGKIGKCYYNNSNSEGGIVSDAKINLGNYVSMFCWVKLVNFYSGSSLTGILGQHRYPANEGLGITMKYVSSTTGYLSINTGNGSGRTYNTYCGSTLLNAGTWYHVGFTYNNGAITFYVNGAIDGTATYANKNIEDYIQLFCWSFNESSVTTVLHGNYKLNGYLNDVRIYDHCLSPKEVHNISKALVLHYSLDDSSISSTVFDESGYQNDGVITGSLQIAEGSGRYRKCANFNGSTYISGPVLQGVAQTASFWLFVPSTIPGTGIVFLDRGSQLAFGYWSSGSTMIVACTNSCQSVYNTSYLIKNAWNHIVIVRPTGSSAPTLYVNGEVRSNNGGSDCWGGSGSEFTIGNRVLTTSYPFTGKISDFRLYATVLSVNDIKSLYNIGAVIDNGANMHTYEYHEIESIIPKVHRTGVTDSSAIVEPDTITNANFSKVGIIKAKNFYEI